MNINENKRNKRTLRGCTYKITCTYISAPHCPIQQNLVQN